jgi:hypothetical protein
MLPTPVHIHPAYSTGENPTNTTRMLPTPVHVHPAYASCGRSPYVATFHESSTELSRPTAPEKKSPQHNPQYTGWSICGSVPSFSPEPANQAVGAKPSIYQWPTTRLTGLISLVCDQNVKYLLTGTNPLILNRHRRGLPHIKPRNSHSTLPTLPFWGFHWSPWMALLSLHFYPTLTSKPNFWVLKNMWPPRGLLTSWPSTVAYIYA